MTKIDIPNLGYVKLINHYGNDETVANVARISFGAIAAQYSEKENRGLIRRLMRDRHTSPFEHVKFTFELYLPMDCWRQWVRHRTANINEYSTRYKPAIDEMATTPPDAWRLQSKDNKQGSSGLLEDWPDGEFYSQREVLNADGLVDGCLLILPNGERIHVPDKHKTPGEFLSEQEAIFQKYAESVYKTRLAFGVAREQARKDLPLSTFTLVSYTIDLHNLFHFLDLRMAPDAQQEIRLYANAVAQLIEPIVPFSYSAFHEFVLNAQTFSLAEITAIFHMLQTGYMEKPAGANLTDKEWTTFITRMATLEKGIPVLGPPPQKVA